MNQTLTIYICFAHRLYVPFHLLNYLSHRSIIIYVFFDRTVGEASYCKSCKAVDLHVDVVLSYLQAVCTMFTLELLIPGLNTPLGEIIVIIYVRL